MSQTNPIQNFPIFTIHQLDNMKILIITGPPYSGKGTQCEILKEVLKYEHISTGDYVRIEKENKTEFALKLAEYQASGDLVPDSLMQSLLRRIMTPLGDKTGIILDGYPRTVSQVDTLLELLDEFGWEIENIINIDVTSDELLKRAKVRAESSDREDDKNTNTHLKRINIFEQDTRPAIAYFASKYDMITVDGMKSIEEVTSEIKTALKIT